MKRRLFVLVLLVMVALSGCDNKDVIKHNYYFYGENDDWLAGLEYDAKEVFTKKKDGALEYDCEDKEKFVATYKGDLSDLANINHIEIGYESKTGGSKFTSDYEEGDGPKGLSFTLSGGGKGGALLQKDEIITVTINLDGDIQTLEIKAKD